MLICIKPAFKREIVNKKPFLKRNWWVFVIFCAFYVGIGAIVYVYQQKLLFASPVIYEKDNFKPDERLERVVIKYNNGLAINGWYVPPKDKDISIILYHGTALSIAYEYWKDKIFALADEGYGVLLAQYRGYGGNPGKPSEQGFYEDSRSYMNWLINNKNKNSQDIVIYGESMGTGAAIKMASEYDVKGVILEGAYSSMVELAQEKYWMFPVHFMMIDQFRSIDIINGVSEPVFFIHGENDEIIPIEDARALYETYKGPKKFVVRPNATHGKTFSKEIVFEFLNSLDG